MSIIPWYVNIVNRNDSHRVTVRVFGAKLFLQLSPMELISTCDNIFEVRCLQALVEYTLLKIIKGTEVWCRTKSTKYVS